MARRYIVPHPATLYETTDTDITIFELAAASDQHLTIIEAHFTQKDSEVSTMEVMEIVRKSAAGTLTAATELPLDPGDSAASFTAGYDASVEGTESGDLAIEAWNILNGYHYVPTPEARIIMEGGDIVAWRIAETLEANITILGYVVVEES